jgi:hypothetical protein
MLNAHMLKLLPPCFKACCAVTPEGVQDTMGNHVALAWLHQLAVTQLLQPAGSSEAARGRALHADAGSASNLQQQLKYQLQHDDGVCLLEQADGIP